MKGDPPPSHPFATLYHSNTERGPPQATTIFELPPDEIQLMREVTNEIQKARRWATFDAIFGRLVLRKAQFFLDGYWVQKWPSKEAYLK